MEDRIDARVLPAPEPSAALEELQRHEGGALALMVTRARGCALRVTPRPDAHARLVQAARDALADAGEGAHVLVWHAEGDVPLGGPVAVVGAAARGRKEAQRAVDVLLLGLKGVAQREDLP